MNLMIISLLCGILFGTGLTLSQMTNPDKVLDFLDITGNWDPSLIFVMGGALGVTLLCFRYILKRPKPLFGQTFYLPKPSAIDKQLIIGAAIFGVGWGMSGYCPGPVVAGLGLGNTEAVIMLITIYMGFMAHRFWDK